MTVLSIDKKIVDNIPIYFEIDKEILEYHAFIKVKRKTIRYYYFSISLPIKKWSQKKITERIHYLNMYICIFKDILIKILKDRNLDYEIIEEEKLQDFNNVKAMIMTTTENNKYKEDFNKMIEGKLYINGIWFS